MNWAGRSIRSNNYLSEISIPFRMILVSYASLATAVERTPLGPIPA